MKKHNHVLAVGILFCLSLINIGCSSSGNVRFLLPDERDILLSSSPTVVAGTIIDEAHVPDLTLEEQLQFGTPSVPQNGYKQEFTIVIDSVVKGSFSGAFVRLHDLKDPKYPGVANPRLWLGPQQKVYVGWQSESGGNFKGLMMVNVEKIMVLDTEEPAH